MHLFAGRAKASKKSSLKKWVSRLVAKLILECKRGGANAKKGL
ncbi:MAG: hypothetical protein ACI9MN_000365 [Saprospiraceae bacterium]|jgi:hypothetical protein|tara:strand:+ start:240 stop:368 length:129 start_codon:yes stop_codon:yes gene_type:complete